MRRGFKSGCELTARRYRRRLGITMHEALPWRELACELDVLLWTTEEVPGLDGATLRQLTGDCAAEWSAVTVLVDDRCAVVVNDAQNARRLPNSVAHELAHIILGHSAARVDVSEDGHLWLTTYGAEQEREADWLAATLLVPRDGLLQAFARYRDVEAIAARFRVSRELVRWRLNATGIVRQVEGRRRLRQQ